MKRTVRGLVLLGILGLAGCGQSTPQTNMVRGSISYHGGPVSGGIIFFHHQKNAFAGSIKADGTYVCSGLPDGDYVVTIDTKSAKNSSAQAGIKKMQEDSARMGGNMPANVYAKASQASPDSNNAMKYVAIPAKYADPKTSGLTASISAGRQTKDFVLAD